MKGRHSPSGRREKQSKAAIALSAQDGDGSGERDLRQHGGSPADEAPRGGRAKKLSLYVALALCLAFTIWVIYGLIQFDHAIENPQEGGFSGWQCEPGRDCRS